MCIVFLAYRWLESHPLVLLGNRDEFYARATQPMAFWPNPQGLLAGKDLQAGGTWLGCHPSGKLAVITNFRQPDPPPAGSPSRGNLVLQFFEENETSASFSKRLQRDGARYAGFNLIFGHWQDLYYYSNRNGQLQPLAPGIHGLSNHLLNTPWPKVARGKAYLSALPKNARAWQQEPLLALLEDRYQPPDTALPNTGVGLQWERHLAPIFIQTPKYGTRASSLLMYQQNGRVTVCEKRWPFGGSNSLSNFKFQL